MRIYLVYATLARSLPELLTFHSGEAPLNPRPHKVLCATFATETKFELGGVPEVAEVLGITAETVKTHLRRLFQKTGASRQLDLAKIVAGFSNPLPS